VDLLNCNWTDAHSTPTEDGRYLVTRYNPVTKKEFVDILWYENGEWWNKQYHDDFHVIAYTGLPYHYPMRLYTQTELQR